MTFYESGETLDLKITPFTHLAQCYSSFLIGQGTSVNDALTLANSKINQPFTTRQTIFGNTVTQRAEVINKPEDIVPADFQRIFKDTLDVPANSGYRDIQYTEVVDFGQGPSPIQRTLVCDATSGNVPWTVWPTATIVGSRYRSNYFTSQGISATTGSS